uniref:Zinc finger protein 532 n=1 Tax=Eptatretus burgeri TaxID=7764 RepID=A0A8C4NII2_EPTBU
MGDMKTPDFDDLLAAFDIPDIDAKEAIQSGGSGAEDGQSSGLRPGVCEDSSDASGQGGGCQDGGAVSVIVRHPRSLEHGYELGTPGGKEGVTSEHAHNGFAVGAAVSIGLGFGQHPAGGAMAFKGGNSMGACKGQQDRFGGMAQKDNLLHAEDDELKEPGFCQFSPISSVEEGEIEDDDDDEEDTEDEEEEVGNGNVDGDGLEQGEVKVARESLLPVQRRPSESCSFLMDRLLGLQPTADTYSAACTPDNRATSKDEKVEPFASENEVRTRRKPKASEKRRDLRDSRDSELKMLEKRPSRKGDSRGVLETRKTLNTRSRRNVKGHCSSEEATTYKSDGKGRKGIVRPLYRHGEATHKAKDSGRKGDRDREREVNQLVNNYDIEEGKACVPTKSAEAANKTIEEAHMSWDGGAYEPEDSQQTVAGNEQQHVVAGPIGLQSNASVEGNNHSAGDENLSHEEEEPKHRGLTLKEIKEKVDGDGDQVLDCLDDLVDENNTEVSKMSTDDETSGSTAQMYSKPAQTTSTKLSSCIEAIAALNAKKAESGCRDVSVHTEQISQELVDVQPVSHNGSSGSPNTAEKPTLNQPESMGKRASGKSGTESPHSVCSETSSKGSPAPSSLSGCGSPPAIPKVRIRTIKTSSGEITRTVTRVLPDFDQDSGVTALHKIPEVSFSPITEQESPSGYTSPSETQLAKATIIAGVTEMVSVATPESIPSSTATTMSLGSSKPGTPSQVINIKFADNTTVKATVLSPVSNPNSSVASASVQAAASHVMLQAASVVKQQQLRGSAAGLVSSASSRPTKILPKTVQLAGLSLVPQAATLPTSTIATATPSASFMNCAVTPTSSSVSPITFVTLAAPPSSTSSTPTSTSSASSSAAASSSLTSAVCSKDSQTATTSSSGTATMVTRGLIAPAQHVLRKVVASGQLGGAQNTVVEAFNRLLNSANPVPLYLPNLNPPASTGITLPATGHRCSECGDSFALEASLARHYARRSLRIEVTCNHCSRGARSLVFYNKCSLLSHARQHKERGVVMQCSHLVMRPLPIGQLCVPGPELISVVPASLATSTPSALPSTTSDPAVAASAGTAVQMVPGSGTTVSLNIFPLFFTCSKILAVILNMCFFHSHPIYFGPLIFTTTSLYTIPGGVINSPDGAGPVAAALPLHDDPMRLTRYSSRCLECSQQFVDGTALAKHFQLQDDGGSQTCQVCQMLLPNKCSYAAHTRIHQHKSPYTCPECGAVCRSSHFQTHIKEICLHFARKVGFRCVHCGLIFAELGTLKTHIQGTHCEVFYKCPLCPMAFKSGPSTRSHAFTQHSGVKVGESKIIYKCSMCDTVFTQQALLYSHFDTHVAKRKVCVFKCPDCTLLFAQKPLMLDHVKSIHNKVRSTDVTTSAASSTQHSATVTGEGANTVKQPTVKQNKQDTTNEVEVAERMAGANARTETRRPTPSRRLRLKNAGWTCTECQNRFVEREVYVSHMKRVHGKPVKKYPCRQCDRSFSSSHSLRRHIRINHEGIRKVYTCWYCTDHARTFTKRFMLENHIRLMHGIKDPDFSQMPGGPGGLDESESVCQDDGKRKAKDDDAGGDDGDGPRLSTRATKKLRVSGGDTAGTAERPYVCAKCEYTTESREDFQRHIPQHRSEGVAWQCSECGLCFTSQPSLGRHLFIVHRIRGGSGDAEQGERGTDTGDAVTSTESAGTAENGGESTTSLEHSSAIAGTNGTGCSVCGKTFENEGALNTHLRTHVLLVQRHGKLSV